MARKKKCDCPPPGSPGWMTTYGDMVTLLLTFFVLLFTTAKIDGREFKLVLSAFNGALGIFDGGQTLTKGRLEEMGMNLETLPSQRPGRQLSKSLKDARERFKPLIRDNKVRISEDERGVIISLLDMENFDPGSAILQPSIRRALDLAGPMLRDIPNFVRVEGHTSEQILAPAPDLDGERQERVYRNNWDLGAARAVNVVNYLIERHSIPARSLQAVSYGSARPLVPEEAGTPEARAANRRVDIVILSRRDYKREKTHPKNPKLPQSQLPTLEYKGPADF